MVLNMANVSNGDKTEPAKSPTPVSPSAKKASLGSSSASNKTGTTPTTSPSSVKAAAAKLNNNNNKVLRAIGYVMRYNINFVMSIGG